jgi:hypothetical protein
MVSPEEHRLISEYSKSELVGGLILGEFARHTRDDDLRTKLTKHAAEELIHAVYWVDALAKMDLPLLEVHDEEKRQYYAKTGFPKTEIELIAMLEALETVAPQHLLAYSKLPGTHPAILEAIEKINAEEAQHNEWGPAWLDQHPDQAAVKTARDKFSALMAEAYDQELRRLDAAGGRLSDLAALARRLRERA